MTLIVVNASIGKMVAKRFAYDRQPERYRRVVSQLADMPPPCCPHLLRIVLEQDCWYALFEWVDGNPLPTVGREARETWELALALLNRMRSYDILTGWPLESLWLERLRKELSGDPIACQILGQLNGAVPSGPRTVAHGDFSVQNMVIGSAGLMLVDWEELGSAPLGFDAGWMLAQARFGHGLISRNEMFERFASAGFLRENLRWFEALGLLRMLFRTRTLPMGPGVRSLVLRAVRRQLKECLA
jgi:hypothetical protein